MKHESVVKARSALAAVGCLLVGLLCGSAARAEAQLPAGYVPLAYIQSTGTQYIDTELVASANAVCEAEVEVPDAKVNTECAFFGAWCPNSKQFVVGFQRKSGTTLFRRAAKNASIGTPFPAAGTKAKIRAEGKTLTVSTAKGTVLSHTLDTAEPVVGCKSTQNLYLFCMNNGTDAGGPMWSGSFRMYSFKMWDGADGNVKLVRNLVPCRNATGEVGMYDLEGEKFYGNKGSAGPFIPGYGVAGALPEGFVRLSYVQATGTQYVNTGLILSENAAVEAVADVVNVSGDYALFGAWNDGSGQFRFNVWRAGSQSVFRRAGTSVNLGAFPAEGVIAQVRAEGKTATVRTFDGKVMQGTIETATAVSATKNPMYLFALDNYGGDWIPGGALMPTPAKMYSFKAWDKSVATGSGALLADFVPCRTPDGEVGFYDLVGGAFHGNAAMDGSKLIGSPHDLPTGYTPLASIESTGSQYICLDPGPTLGSNACVETVVEFPTRAQGDQVVFGAWCGSWNHQFRFNVNRGKDGSTSSTFRRAKSSVGLGTLPAEGRKVSLRFDGLTGTMRSFDSGEIIQQATIGASDPIFACCEPMRLFNLYTVSTMATLRMYAFQAWDAFEAGGAPVQVFDLVPCLNEKGEAGFYNRVGGQFYGNAVTDGDDFLPGYPRLPEGYEVVGSIESTGTQYINTLMTPSATAVVEVEAEISDEAESGDGMLFGAWCVGSKGQFRIGYRADKSSLYFARANIGKYIDETFLGGGKRANFRVEGKTLTVSTAAGAPLTYTLDTTDPVYACNQPMCLFGLNDGTKTPGGSGTPSMFGKFKMYSYRVWDKIDTSNELTMIADFLPCSNGTAYGMFDRISGQFFPNLGGGDDFIGGKPCFWYDGDVLKVCDGELPELWIEGYCTSVEKTGTGTAFVGAVTEVPALTVSEGQLSLVNGTPDTLTVKGALALVGGASIGVDLDKSNGCDQIAAGSIDLSAASAANPVVINVKKISGTWKDRYLLLSGGSLTTDDAAKFTVSGTSNLILQVIGGDLYLVPDGIGSVIIIR